MITQTELKEALDYNKNTGLFVWKKVSKYQPKKVNKIAGGFNSNGYIEIRVHGKKYKAHRLAWLYEYGEFPTYHIDHINQDRADNRICNLRDVKEKDNNKNQTKYKNNTSGVTGVVWSKQYNKWQAQIGVSDKVVKLGEFVEFSDAVNARKNAEVLYGFHENHGKDK